MCYFVENYRYVYAIANRRVPHYVDDRENIKQEAVAQAWVRFPILQARLSNEYPIRTILRWAAVEGVRDAMRGKRLAGRPGRGYRDAMTLCCARDYLVAARDDSRIDVDELITLLPEETQDVARLLSFGYGKEDIAIRLDVGRSTVFNRCKLIRRVLSRILASQAA